MIQLSGGVLFRAWGEGIAEYMYGINHALRDKCLEADSPSSKHQLVGRFPSKRVRECHQKWPVSQPSPF